MNRYLKHLIWLLAVLSFVLLPCLGAFAGEPWTGRIGEHPDWIEGQGFDTSDVPIDSFRWTENNWSDWVCRKLNLPTTNDVREYTTPSGHHVDIKAHVEAIETEWDRKFHASVGQALHYGFETDLEPAVILLVRDPEEPYIDYCRRICRAAGVRLYIQLIPPRKDRAELWLNDSCGGLATNESMRPKSTNATTSWLNLATRSTWRNAALATRSKC
ncbi:MAG: hypothetical protein ACF8CY_02390 [Gimesia chilikensis]